MRHALGQCGLILMQLRISNIEQSVRRNIDHLVIGDALGEQVGAEREIASASGFSDLTKRLEHFPIRLNRRGFPNQHLSDSSCMLVLEASMHGQSPFERSSAACH